MFIDMHVHPAFYEPICSSERVLENRHNSLNIYRNGKAPIKHVINQMKCAGIDKLCLLGQDEKSIDGKSIVSNEEVAQLVNMEPEKFIGFASVDPLSDTAEDDLNYAFKDLKLSGLKLNPSKQHYYPHDCRVKPLLEICIKYNKPVIFHSGLSWEEGALSKFSRPIEFEEVACSYPDLRICLAHFGWPWVRETSMLMLKYSNVYADTALLYFDSADEFFRQTFTRDIPITWLERSLRHQVMFGSNNPRFEQIRMAHALSKLGFSDETLSLIKGINAMEFINGKKS